MTQSIYVIYSVRGIHPNIAHMAIIYDKGNGATPQVIEALPQIEYDTGNAAQNAELFTEEALLLNGPQMGSHRHVRRVARLRTQVC